MVARLTKLQYMFVILLVVLATNTKLSGCDMIAMIAKGDNRLDFNLESATFQQPLDYLKFIQNRSSIFNNRDGYGILYYKSSGSFYYNESVPQDYRNQVWYQKGLNTYYKKPPLEYFLDWTWEMDQAVRVLKSEQTNAKIAMAHARKGTGGSGNHPFLFRWNGKTYSFMHNGNVSGVKATLFEQTFAKHEWRRAHPSNWAPKDSEKPDDYIDTEVLFHWLMKNIIESDGSVLIGLQKGLAMPVNGLESLAGCAIHNYLNSIILNFVLSDGEKLYLFRGTAQNGTSYNLSFQQQATFWGVKTQSNENGENLDQYELVCLSSNSEPLRIPNFSHPRASENILASKNYPNPFNSETNIEFSLQKESSVKITIYNYLGQKLEQRNLGLLSKGMHIAKWNFNFSNSTNLSSGIYFYQIESDNSSVISRVMLLK